VAAGIVPGFERNGLRRKSSGILGVLAGFALVLILAAAMSVARGVFPRHVHFDRGYAPPFELQSAVTETNSGYPDSRSQLIVRERRWRYGPPLYQLGPDR
jgi:hypothetical protein